MTMPSEDEVRFAVRWLVGAGWQVRPNPILHKIRAVQLSSVYTQEGVRYVDVVTLSFNAPSLLLHCLASYDPEFPFDHNVIWERFMPVEEALEYAVDLHKYLTQPTEPERADQAHAQQHQGGPDQQASEWFLHGQQT
jgi:hypothetical protein